MSAQELEAVDDEEQPQAALAALIEARARARATGASHAQRKRQFVEHFRNTSLILDCVSCEKIWSPTYTERPVRHFQVAPSAGVPP